MTPRGLGAAVVWACVIAVVRPSLAQVAGSNLLLGQLGNYPGYVPKNRHDLYDQLNLEFAQGSMRLGARYELNRNSEQQFMYEGVTQRWAGWADGPVRARVGSFTSILGRGLIHRSFELPGVVLDQIGIRSRYAFSREMDGAQVEVNTRWADAMLFSGSANGGTNSLAAEKLGLERFSGQFEAAQIAVAPHPNARIGAAYLRSNSAAGPGQELGTGFADVDPLGVLGVQGVGLPLYFEYAQADRGLGDWWSLARGADVPHALYASAGLVWGRLGFTAEWKDYAQFRLGTNDPPSLVREHGFALLNRNTHVLDPGRETGHQFELSYAPRDGVTLTANASRADGVSINRYREQYLELRVAPSLGRWDATVFWDAAEDRISALDDSRTLGLETTVRAGDAWSTHLDLEHQSAEHPAGSSPPTPFEDLHLACSVSRADRGSLGLVWERTSDPLVRSVFGGGGAFLHLISWQASARIAQGQEAMLTVGKSRGGRACTAGTCYEVPAFDGAELRLVSRF